MTTTYPESPGTHMIVLPGGGYAAHAPHEAEPVASWLSEIGMQASVFRYPLNVRHPAPLDALRAEIRRRRADGAQRIGLYRPARLILLGEDASPQLRRSTSLDSLVTQQSPPFFV